MVRFLIILAFSPVLVLVLHSIASQFITPRRPDISRQFICVASSLTGNIPMAIILWFATLNGLTDRPIELISTAVYGLIVYNAIGYTYFHLFNMSETARRVRVLSEINNAGKLIEQEIIAIYDKDNMFDIRINRLLSLKQIKQVNDSYILRKHLLYYTAKIVSFWARLIGFHFLDRFDHK